MPENKSLELALKESEAKYRELFENANDGIYTHDTDGFFLTVNDALCKIFECATKDELIGTNISGWLTPESSEIAKDINNKYISGEQVKQPIVLELISKKNNHVFVEFRNRIIKEDEKIVAIHGIGRDITDKIRLEQELKKSEKKYRDLFENANDISYTHDLNGTILNINKIGSRVLDATETEIIGSNIKEWVSPDSFKIFEDRVRKIFLNQPLEQPVVIEVIKKNGEHRWGEATTRLIKDGNRIIGVHGIVRDITEKIRLKKELTESEEKYRDLFENAQDTMYVTDNEVNFLKMNNIGIQTLGCTKEEVIGSNISRWVTPDSLRIIQERQKKRLSGVKVNPTDILEIVCKNGDHRWVEIRTRIIRSDDGRIEYHGIARDITENRLLKQELNKSNRKQKLLCHLIQGTRGGKTRALILNYISDKSYNANQLSTALNMDYKTIRHHLNVLMKNGIVGKSNDGSYDIYFTLNDMDLNLNG